MNEDHEKLPDKIAFIADAHLGLPGSLPGHEVKIVSFLRWLNGNVSHLYIAGDLFDYWFEYKTVVPNTAPKVVFELYNLVRSGIEITILAGNHDYWLGPYLEETVGVTIALNEVIAEHQGLKLYIHHGDGLYPGDHGYRLLKKVLRNRFSIRLFSLIHPDLASRIAQITSKTSRQYLAPPVVYKKSIKLFRNIGDERLADGYDAVLYGHCHVPHMEQREKGTLILLGDWIKNSTYVLLENGTFTLCEWSGQDD